MARLNLLKKNILVCHLTSVHHRYDTRIFFKECTSLKKNGYQVVLLVADGKGDEIKNGIQIYDVGKPSNRLKRMLLTTRKILRKALEINAAIYHLHDPELMPISKHLHRHDKIVIFDAHEDLPKQILSKPYLNIVFRHLLSWVLNLYERMVFRKFQAIIAATPKIRDKIKLLNPNTIDINNYPSSDELTTRHKLSKSNRAANNICYICYIGAISEIRGARQMVEALSLVKNPVRLILAGNISDPALSKDLVNLAGWRYVDAQGFVNRQEVTNIMHSSIAGLVTFLPAPNHIHSQPNKMFEYMAAGLAVIASDFPLWREIIEGNQCGLCVNPSRPQEIASAIDYLVSNPKIAREMGQRGAKAVKNKYNWWYEEKKLLQVYSLLIDKVSCN